MGPLSIVSKQMLMLLYHHGCLDTAVVLHYCHFVLLRRMKLFATTEELA